MMKNDGPCGNQHDRGFIGMKKQAIDTIPVIINPIRHYSSLTGFLYVSGCEIICVTQLHNQIDGKTRHDRPLVVG